MGAREAIKHVVVLMLENRSFDCMLGKLREAGPAFNGLTSFESNPYNNRALNVWSASSIDYDVARIPTPDPGESFADMNQQLFGAGGRTLLPPPMVGFAANYADQRANPDAPYPADVMHYFTPEQLPVISKLASAFGVSDQWH